MKQGDESRLLDNPSPLKKVELIHMQAYVCKRHLSIVCGATNLNTMVSSYSQIVNYNFKF
jgi:hypothetical protein